MLLGPNTFKTADDNLFFPMASNSGTRGDKPVIKSFQSFWQLAVQLAQESVFFSASVGTFAVSNRYKMSVLGNGLKATKICTEVTHDLNALFSFY